MSPWTARIAVEDAAAVFRDARAHGLAGDPSTVFHDLGLLTARVGELHARFPPGTLHTVAVKANPLVEILRAAVDAGAGLEAASMEEVHLALAAGCPAGRIVYDSPAKTPEDIAQAVGLGVRLNADNLDELARIAPYAPPAAGLRVNPGVGAGAIAITSVAAKGSKFGVPLETGAEAVFRAYAAYPWLTTLHVHVGSQGCPLALLVAGVARAEAFRREVNGRLGRVQIDTLDIGGGLPVAYRPEERVPSLAEYVEALRAEVPSLFEARLVTEFGRAVQAACGWAASRVEYVKDTGDGPLAVVHVGADLLLRRAYLPQDWHHELAVLDADGVPRAGPARPWSVAGPLCFSGDFLGRGVPLPDPRPGDFLLVRDVGAYTMGMWSRHCSRGMPAVLGYDAAGFRLLRARETPADVVAFWSRDR